VLELPLLALPLPLFPPSSRLYARPVLLPPSSRLYARPVLLPPSSRRYALCCPVLRGPVAGELHFEAPC